MSSSAKRKLLLQRPVALDLGCSCRRTKLAYLFSFPPSKPKTHCHHPAPPDRDHHPLQPHHRFWSYYPFSPNSTATTSPFDTGRYPSSTSATTPSPCDVDDHDPASTTSPFSDDATSWATCRPKPPAAKEKLPAGAGCRRRRVDSESVAVVVDSRDPYKDFRDSMLQMIVEKEIYAWEDLRELLHRLIALNSPYHHDAILRAFSDICNSVFAAT